MSAKIMIAYASRHGSTEEVAEAIAETLRGRGFEVSLRRAEEVHSLEGYDAVVLGSGVRFGQWLAPAVHFVERFQDQLRSLPTAFFSVHILNLDDSEVSQHNRLGYLEAVHKMVRPQYEAFFPGKLEPHELNFFERLISRLVQTPEGDLRQWQKICDWANKIFQEEPALAVGQQTA